MVCGAAGSITQTPSSQVGDLVCSALSAPDEHFIFRASSTFQTFLTLGTYPEAKFWLCLCGIKGVGKTNSRKTSILTLWCVLGSTASLFCPLTVKGCQWCDSSS